MLENKKKKGYQKVIGAHSYICKSYRGKVGRGGGFWGFERKKKNSFSISKMSTGSFYFGHILRKISVLQLYFYRRHGRCCLMIYFF